MSAPNLAPELLDLARWIQQQLAQHPFGTFGGSVIVHAGQIKRVVRNAEHSVKPDEGTHNADRTI